MMSKKVQRLPSEVRSRLQSGVTIADATQTVLELVQNSLDAESTAIAVRVDLKKHQLQVVDNGIGITKDDLELIGERYMTSKCHHARDLEQPIMTYGYRGQVIASMLDLCTMLTIESKSRKERQTIKKIFINGRPQKQVTNHRDRPSTGTTVTVEEFMSTMPVRQKRINEVFDIEEIRHQLQILAIIHNQVSFSLRDDAKRAVLLQTHRKPDVIHSFAQVFGLSTTKFLLPISYKEEKYQITGFVSKEPQPQKNLQLLYVNKRIVGKSMVHSFVNDLLNKYTNRPKRLPKLEASERNRHHIFMIQIQCPYKYFEIFSNLRKTTVEFRYWEEVLKSIHKAVKTVFKNEETPEVPKKILPKKLEKKEHVNPKFGTSQLVNAVRGAPAKRKLPFDQRKDRKVICNQIYSSETLFSTGGGKKRLASDFSAGLPESPIPRHVSRISSFVRVTKLTKVPLSEFDDLTLSSIRHFQDWLKFKAKTDLNALRLLKEFFEFRKKHRLKVPSGRKMIRKPKTPEILFNKERKMMESSSDVKETPFKIPWPKKTAASSSKNPDPGHKSTPVPKHAHSQTGFSLQKGYLCDKGVQAVETNSKLSRTPRMIPESPYAEEKSKTAASEGNSMLAAVLTDVLAGIKTNERSSAPMTDTAPVEQMQSSQKSATQNVFKQVENILKSPITDNVTIKNIQNVSDSLVSQIGDTALIQEVQASSESSDSSVTQITDTAPDKKIQTFTVTGRYSFVPKGFSPIILTTRSKKPPQLSSQDRNIMRTAVPTSDHFLDTVKWKNDCGEVTKPAIPSGILNEMEEKAQEKSIFYEKDVLSASVNRSAVKVHNMLHSVTFVREMFDDVRVVGQLDKKFIIAVVKGPRQQLLDLLILFDQHAVDERIRLEKLMREYRTEEGEFTSSRTEAPIVLPLNESTVRIVSRFKEKLGHYGLNVTVLNENTVSVSSVPTCLLDKEERDVKNKGDNLLETQLQNLITDIAQELLQTRGTSSSVPRVLHNVISSQACRTAVKFNQFLSMEEMRKMLVELRECEAPFQCAHGRPSVVPIIDLKDFQSPEKTKIKANFRNLLEHR